MPLYHCKGLQFIVVILNLCICVIALILQLYINTEEFPKLLVVCIIVHNKGSWMCTYVPRFWFIKHVVGGQEIYVLCQLFM